MEKGLREADMEAHRLLLVCFVTSVLSMDVKNGPDDVIKDLPCVKRLNQLFCNSPGSIYPGEKISGFITDNKALLRRMFGEQQEQRTITRTTVRVVQTHLPTRFAVSPLLLQPQFASKPQGFQRFRRDVLEGTLEEMLEPEIEDEDFDLRWKSDAGNSTETGDRRKRQAEIPDIPEQNIDNTKADVCESKTEIVSPFWASNSNGKVRAILNNKEFEQAIHQEICTQPSTLRCNRDCSCEQKYKWHRLLAYDPNNDCAGIFMDWFLYPSCCVCRCAKNPFLVQ